MTTNGTRALICAVLAAATLGGCHRFGHGGRRHENVAAAKQAIAADEQQWNQDFHSKNLAGLVNHYASDAVFVLPGMAAQVGTEQIKKAYAGALKDPNFDVTFASDRVDVARSGDLAYSQGHFTMKGSDPKTRQDTATATGTYLTIFRKQEDDSWKAVQDWAAANPAAASK
jgi:uncharacterized protein (TIGR02246 family)